MKTKPIAGPITKSIWVEGVVRWRGPKRSHMTMLWILWGISLGLLSIWLIGMMTQFMLGGWVHLALVFSLLLGVYCCYYGIRYCDYLERPKLKKIQQKFRRVKADEETVNFDRHSLDK